MANFTPSNLVKAQALLQEKFTKNEMREKTLPALTLAMKSANVLVPSANQLRTREDRAVEAYVMARSKRTAGSTRTHNHTGTRNDSFAVPLTWTTYSDVFSISLKQLDNNIFSFEQALAQGFENCIMNIRGDIETGNIAYLMAQRSQISAAIAAGAGAFNATNDAFEVPLASKAQFFQLVENLMAANNYRGRYDVIADQATYINGSYYANQGGGNSANTSFQFNNMNVVRSTELTDADYAGGVALVMPESSFANIPWIPKQNRTGHGDYNSYLGGYGSISDGDVSLGDPNVLEYAVHGYTQRADTSASNGNTQDDLMEFEVSVDIARVLSPLSVATESVVFEAAQLTA